MWLISPGSWLHSSRKPFLSCLFSTFQSFLSFSRSCNLTTTTIYILDLSGVFLRQHRKGKEAKGDKNGKLEVHHSSWAMLVMYALQHQHNHQQRLYNCGIQGFRESVLSRNLKRRQTRMHIILRAYIWRIPIDVTKISSAGFTAAYALFPLLIPSRAKTIDVHCRAILQVMWWYVLPIINAPSSNVDVYSEYTTGWSQCKLSKMYML